MKLYVYTIKDGTDKRDKAIENYKNLREINDWHYLGKEKSFVADETEIIADYTLSEWVEDYFYEEESKFEMSSFNGIFYDIWFSNKSAIEVVVDLLKGFDEDLDYSDRIFNSEDVYAEITDIINETTITLMTMAIDDLRDKIIKMEHIDWL